VPWAAAVFLAALVTALLVVPPIRAFALRVGAVQEGGGRHGRGRRRHQGAVPNVGGLALLAAFLVAVAVGATLAPAAWTVDRGPLFAILLGGVLMTLVGLLDDLWDLPVAMRLAVQTVAAGILVANDVSIAFVTNYFAVGPFARWAFIDGVDGLSSGVAAIGSLSLLAVALQVDGRGAAVLLLAALAGAATGFLRHNAGPATIFMGDAGAYLLGYVLAAVSVLGALKVTAAVTIATPVLILGVPVVNIAQVTLRRLRRGANPARAHNDHLHDLLRARGRSERGVVLTLWTATLVLGVAGMLLAATPPAATAATVLLAVAATGGASALRWAEVRAAERAAERAGAVAVAASDAPPARREGRPPR
jgi:UDP-GlcNAc:undecaprenyl-phosphate GlcNAc-1-phosphate transferase